MKYELGPKDKTPNGWGYHDFHHTDPQRRIPCAVGEMLAPASADDIPPIDQAAADSVRRAFDLLACLVGDRDHNLAMGNADHNGKLTEAAKAIELARDGVMAILRIRP